MKKKDKKGELQEEPKCSPIASGIIKIVFELVKYFVSDPDLGRNFKKSEESKKEFEDLKTLLSKLQAKTDDCMNRIDRLQSRILWGNIILIAVLVTLLLQMLLLN